MSDSFNMPPSINLLIAMSRQRLSPSASASISGVIAAFYDHLEASDTDCWATLWSDDGVYLNPFASGPRQDARVEGRDEVVETIGQMRSAFDALEFRGRVEEPALVPQNPAIVVYVTGDCHFTLPGDSETHRHHFHHRLEILDGHVTGWIDYTNPLTDSDAVPAFPFTQATTESDDAEFPPVAPGDGVPAAAPARLESSRSCV